MKQAGMLVVSLRGKIWILLSLRVFRAKRQCFEPPRSRLGFREETELHEEKQKSNFLFSSIFSFFKRSLLGVKISLSHAQIGLL